MKRIAILANGLFPAHSEALRALREAQHIVCCDGAAQALLAHGREPDFVVGDGDSLPAPQRSALGSRYIRISEQDTNDLQKAFTFSLQQYAQSAAHLSITLLGCNGKREDHALGNIFRLPAFRRQLAALGLPFSLRMVSDFGVFTPFSLHAEIEVAVGQQISVFAPPGVRLRSEGLHWPLHAFAELWEGTLNRADAARVVIDADGDFLIYTAHL